MLSCDSIPHMAQLLVRDISPDLVKALKARAASNGRSAEAEHRLILEEQLKPPVSDFWERARAARDELRGKITGNSADLIHEERMKR